MADITIKDPNNPPPPSNQPRVRASARIRLTLEISANDSWGNDCTIAQVQKQARDKIRQRLSKLFEKKDDVVVIGPMRTIAMLVEED